jgi:putative phosphoribosyl transferase
MPALLVRGVQSFAQSPTELGILLDPDQVTFSKFVAHRAGHQELGFGAVTSGGVRILNNEVIRQWQIPDKVIETVTDQKVKELKQRESVYRGNKPPLDVHGQIVILVDNGLATGSTMLAAIVALRKLDPVPIVVGVPVGAPETCSEFQSKADESICVRTPEPFFAVGMWYTDFSQTQDEEVCDLLSQAAIEFGATNQSCALS